MGCLPLYRVKSLIKKVQEDTIRETLNIAQDMFEIQYDYDIEGYITHMKISKDSIKKYI